MSQFGKEGQGQDEQGKCYDVYGLITWLILDFGTDLNERREGSFYIIACNPSFQRTLRLLMLGCAPG